MERTNERNTPTRLTLVLGDDRIDVAKTKLTGKTGYFASLFSHNFSDSNETEHIVRYDISFATLQNFIEWVQDDEEPLGDNENPVPVKRSLAKFLSNNFAELCDVLHVSIIYGAESLTEDLTDILITRWLTPGKLLDVWLMAQDLGLNVLADVSFSLCLDLFEELPFSSLAKLSEEKFLRLVCNVNVNSSPSYLQFVQREWTERHRASDLSVSVPNIPKTREPKFLEGTVLSKLSDSSVDKAYIHVWDGFSFTPVTKLKEMPDSRKEMVGMRVVGRGFNIYMVGGEMGLGTGRFNHAIWRYCLLSRKWYYQARLPVPRRHMIAVFIGQKLVIVGGVGRHRIKLDKVDLLDVHTGEWTNGEEMHDDFTEVPAHCVANGKLYILRVDLHIYEPDSNRWSKTPLPGTELSTDCTFFANETACYFLEEDESGETVLSRVNATNDPICQKEECLKSCKEHAVYTNLPVYNENRFCKLRSMNYRDSRIVLLASSGVEYRGLHLRSVSRPDLKDYRLNPKSGCFRVIDPATLYDTV